MHARDATRWVLWAVYGVFWAGGIFSQCFGARAAQPWAAALFLLLAAALVVLDSTEVWVLALFAAGGFGAELAGAHTGIPFGRYSYTGALGPAAGGVPVAIACAWLTLLAASRELAWRASRNQWVAAVFGAAIMTVSDLLVDPVATRKLAYWHWEQVGAFFGVPLVNFEGWFAVSFGLLWLAGRPAKSSMTAVAVGGTILCFFAVLAVFA